MVLRRLTVPSAYVLSIARVQREDQRKEEQPITWLGVISSTLMMSPCNHTQPIPTADYSWPLLDKSETAGGVIFWKKG